jgi:hypothetical protein
MATTIQLLRSDIAQTRPEPNVLANGTPMVNLHESEPGLFFTARDGSLFKVGPTSVGPLPPNSFPQGEPGNSAGELWLDTSAADPVLRIYDGAAWVACIEDVGGTVTSVGLSFDGVFSVGGSPVTSSGVISAELDEQTAGSVFAGPISGANSAPAFRSLAATDIPNIPGGKITSGTIDSARIANLAATQVTSGTFSPDRIPNLPADKITFGVLSPAVGGTGTTAIPTDGQLLVGTGAGWSVASLTAGANIDVTPGSGSLQVSVSGASTFDSVALRDGTGDTLTLAAPNVTVPYALNLPSSDGTNGAVLVTDGGGQLSFQTSLFGLASIGGAADLTINAGGVNGNVILAPTGSGEISASGSRLTDLPLPVNATDAASKSYVDSVAAGLKPKEQVVVASTANIDLTTGGLLTIDGVVLSVGQRVLVKNQLFPEQNGIYEVALGAWTRTSDANTFVELVGATVFVAGGPTNIGKTFLCDSPAGGTIDVDPVDWIVFSSGVGTVTSVGLTMPAPFTVAGSPVTTSGTLAVTLNTQTANRVFAGPVSGGAAAPTFRALAAADVPNIDASKVISGTFAAARVPIALNSHTFTGITPDADATRDLGSPSLRWANIYSADLNLSNEGGSNSVDGTWGSYTIQEGEDDLYLINRRSGKRYKFLLQEV